MTVCIAVLWWRCQHTRGHCVLMNHNGAQALGIFFNKCFSSPLNRIPPPPKGLNRLHFYGSLGNGRRAQPRKPTFEVVVFCSLVGCHVTYRYCALNSSNGWLTLIPNIGENLPPGLRSRIWFVKSGDLKILTSSSPER